MPADMSITDIRVQLFEYGGGIVMGTADVEKARTCMKARIREEWETASPVPWQMYDFTDSPPTVERGRVVEDPTDLDFALWQQCENGIEAVVWR